MAAALAGLSAERRAESERRRRLPPRRRAGEGEIRGGAARVSIEEGAAQDQSQDRRPGNRAHQRVAELVQERERWLAEKPAMLAT